MDENWSSLDILKPPRTVGEAIERLLLVLTVEDRLAIAAMQQDELFDLHFTLGLSIRNAFDLHDPGNKLLAACDTTTDPDEASYAIITALWNRLQQDP